MKDLQKFRRNVSPDSYFNRLRVKGKEKFNVENYLKAAIGIEAMNKAFAEKMIY